jgi:tetratricopeptide (TPR) repeat protein
VESVAFSPDGTRIFACGLSFVPPVTIATYGTAWDARTGEELKGEVIPPTLPNERISPDGRLFAHVDGNRVELVSLKPDAEEIDYRRLHTQPDQWRYREGYLAARVAKDDFATRFYLDLIPQTDRRALVARADVNALAPLLKRVEEHRQAEEWDKALPLLVEIANVMKTKLGPDDPETLEAMTQLGGVYCQMGQLDKSIPVFEEVLKAQEAKLGRGHRDTLRTMQTLALTYKDADRLKEAIPLLEEVWRAEIMRWDVESEIMRWYPEMIRWYVEPLLDAYLKAGEKAKLNKVIQELVAKARKTPPPDSSQLVRLLEYYSALGEKFQPDAWETFNTRSLLGGALLAQQKYADAEPLLLAGYEGLKQREKMIQPPDLVCIPEAIERLVQLYEATGRKDEAAKWRKELEARKKE